MLCNRKACVDSCKLCKSIFAVARHHSKTIILVILNYWAAEVWNYLAYINQISSYYFYNSVWNKGFPFCWEINRQNDSLIIRKRVNLTFWLNYEFGCNTNCKWHNVFKSRICVLMAYKTESPKGLRNTQSSVREMTYQNCQMIDQKFATRSLMTKYSHN